MQWNNVKRIGRTFEDNGILWFSFSGTGIEFECDEGFEIDLVADTCLSADDAEIHYARYAVFADGAMLRDERLTTSEYKVRIELAGKHVFGVMKLSESNDSSLGIKKLTGIGAADIVPAEEKRIHLELIGDSITCGYGVEGNLSQCYTTATENFSLAWGYLLCKRLGAEWSAVSKSGAGLISGYTGNAVRESENILTKYYDTMGCSMFGLPGGSRPSDFKYDFDTRFDYVVINVGTNDVSFCRPSEVSIPEDESEARCREFYSEYKRFLEKVRRVNPFAKIICILGIMGQGLNNEVKLAVEELTMAGDKRLWYLPLTPINPEDGYGTDYHPSEISQKKLADEVYAFISEL